MAPGAQCCYYTAAGIIPKVDTILGVNADTTAILNHDFNYHLQLQGLEVNTFIIERHLFFPVLILLLFPINHKYFNYCKSREHVSMVVIIFTFYNLVGMC